MSAGPPVPFESGSWPGSSSIAEELLGVREIAAKPRLISISFGDPAPYVRADPRRRNPSHLPRLK